jgi:hypothetical protein
MHPNTATEIRHTLNESKLYAKSLRIGGHAPLSDQGPPSLYTTFSIFGGYAYPVSENHITPFKKLLLHVPLID